MNKWKFLFSIPFHPLNVALNNKGSNWHSSSITNLLFVFKGCDRGIRLEVSSCWCVPSSQVWDAALSLDWHRIPSVGHDHGHPRVRLSRIPLARQSGRSYDMFACALCRLRNDSRLRVGQALQGLSFVWLLVMYVVLCLSISLENGLALNMKQIFLWTPDWRERSLIVWFPIFNDKKVTC